MKLHRQNDLIFNHLVVKCLMLHYELRLYKHRAVDYQNSKHQFAYNNKLKIIVSEQPSLADL